MKKIFIPTLIVLLITISSSAQTYFQGTFVNQANSLVFKIKPINGNITLRFSAIEFFVRVPTGSPTFSFGTQTIAPTFSGVSFTVRGPNSYGAEAGFNNYVFEWIGGATFIPASATTFTQNVEYEVFRVPLVGVPPNTIDVQLIHNTDQNPSYLNLSDNLGNSWSCLDNAGASRGPAFYGPGFFTAAGPGGGTNNILPILAVPLPIKFANFTATKKANDGILNWSAENESNLTSSYEVERSFNGVDFKKFETVASKNNGLSSNDYTLTDFNLSALKSSGVIYYRIKQIDTDGKFVYSVIRTVVLDPTKFVITVSPNPVKDVTSVRFNLEKEETISILVIDANGKQMQQIQMQAVKGFNNKTINMANLASGTYQLVVKTSAEVKTISVVKIN